MTTTLRTFGEGWTIRGLAHAAATRLTALTSLMAAMLATGVAVAQGAQPKTQPCWVKGARQQASCGSLSVPLVAGDPRSPRIDIHFVVIGAQARNKKPDPIIYFAGGPGQSAIDLAGPVSQALGPLLSRRDLILIDQRGTGRSAPLRCEGGPDVTGREAELERLARCRRALQALPHGDLRQYSTAAAVADTEAIRIALGTPRVNLVGTSYGTRMVLEYLRRHPQSVRRAVLDGPTPPDMVLPVSAAADADAALQAVWRHCRADAACNQAWPALQQRIGQLLATLPRPVTLVDPESGEERRLTLTPAALLGLLRAPLYVPSLTAALPAAAHAASEGRIAPLYALARSAQVAAGRGGFSEGLHYAVVCSEDAPWMPPPPLADHGGFGPALGEFYREVCAQWPRAKLPADFRRFSPTPVPAMVLTGGADPTTPTRHGERLVQGLGARARLINVPQGGHALMFVGCAPALVNHFIDTQEDARALALKADCLQRIPRPPLFHPLTPRSQP